MIPVEITIFEDRSFTFVLKTPPASDLIKKALNVDKGSGTAGKTGRQLSPRQAARDRRAEDEGSERHRSRGGEKIIEGTARSMGIDTTL